MEKEYKWRADPQILGQVLLWASSRIGTQSRTIYMRSQYLDTVDGALRSQGAALRLRRENEKTMCCMKLRGDSAADGLRVHEEYQCEAATIEEGLALLPEQGAPARICAFAAEQPLVTTCEVNFRRSALLLQQDNTVCELALDEGTLSRAGKTAPLCEIELELIAGDEAVFHALAAELSSRLALVPEPQSKLTRALAL